MNASTGKQIDNKSIISILTKLVNNYFLARGNKTLDTNMVIT